jgi:hypothetical protein
MFCATDWFAVYESARTPSRQLRRNSLSLDHELNRGITPRTEPSSDYSDFLVAKRGKRS